jgi:Spy/CpxP family protein refolding chaperone
MDFFTKNKMLFWCVIILAVLNVVTLVSFWVGKPPRRLTPDSRRGQDGGKIMAERLQLTDEQAKQLEQIRNEHFMRTGPLQDDTHKIRLDILHELFNSEPNQTRIQNLLAEISSKQDQFEKYLFTHFQELKNACNEDQAKELKIMLRDLIESTRPRDPERRSPGPDSGMQPGRRPPPPIR